MTRVTNAVASRRRRKRTLKLAKGYWGDRKNHRRITAEAVNRAMSNNYIHRKKKKGDFRSLWIMRIGVAAKINGMSYSKLIQGLKVAGCELNRKMLAEIALNDPQSFANVAEQAKHALTTQAKA